jgi:hypothetical protein
MKPLWAQTLAWIAAIAIAVLLAMSGPETSDTLLPDPVPQGGTVPR